MESIIKKAIEGGYDQKLRTDNIPHIECVFDPLFWQSIGKACTYDVKEENNHAKWSHKDSWKHYAIRFHEINLTEGWNSAVEYLLEVIK